MPLEIRSGFAARLDERTAFDRHEAGVPGQQSESEDVSGTDNMCYTMIGLA